MNMLLAGLLLFLTACAAAPAAGLDPAPDSMPVNEVCPRSGKPVAADALTEYRGHVVGFCNPQCRDDFAAHRDERPEDRAFFDAAIARIEARR